MKSPWLKPKLPKVPTRFNTKSGFYFPDLPLSSTNGTVLNGVLRRPDLDENEIVYRWGGGWWTRKELERYGAL